MILEIIKLVVTLDLSLSIEDSTWIFLALVFHETWGIGFPKKTQVKIVESDKFTVRSLKELLTSFGDSNPIPLGPFGPLGPGGPGGPRRPLKKSKANESSRLYNNFGP